MPNCDPKPCVTFAACPACRALILRAQTVTGGCIVLDALPVQNGLFTLEDGVAVAGPGRLRYTNHAVTCPGKARL
jgi:hypothetical protein